MKFILVTVMMALAVIGCSKDKTEQPAAQTTPAPVVQTANDQAADWQSFKFEAEMKIAALEDSLAKFDEAMLDQNPKYRAQLAHERAIRARAAAIRAALAHRDEAAGSMKRAGEAISGGIDTLGTDIAGLFSSKKK
jgi:hypothetical protein